MKLTKREIQKIKHAFKAAERAKTALAAAIEKLSNVIIETTRVEGNVNLLAGDGFGFCTENSNDSHIPVDVLIELASNGSDISEKMMLNNVSL